MLKLKNKRSWIRIVEAFIGVIIVMTAILVAISRQPDYSLNQEEEIGVLQKHILSQISYDPTLRNQVLGNNPSGVNALVQQFVPTTYNYTVRICPLGRVCSLGFYIPGNVYTEEYVVTANLSEYDPKIVKIFWWEGNFPDDYHAVCGDGTCDSLSENQDNCAADCGEACVEECSSSETKCSSDLRQIITRSCSDINGNGCKKYGSWTTQTTCPTNQLCKNNVCVPAWAALSLRFSGTVHTLSGSTHYYYHTRTFTETNGVGLTLTQGQLCYDKPAYHCDAQGAVNYRINAGSNLIHTNKEFHTPYIPDKFTLKYWGTDDNGNAVYIEQKMCVNGASFTENC